MLGGKKRDFTSEKEVMLGAPEEGASQSAKEPILPAPVPGTDEGSTFIAKGSEFVGKLTFEGTVRIDGNVQGEIFSKGTLVIGPGAMIKATIHVSTCQILGEVHGNIRATKKLELKKPGKLYGDIQTPTLVLEAGVIFEGNCKMENLEGKPSGNTLPKSVSAAAGSLKETPQA